MELSASVSKLNLLDYLRYIGYICLLGRKFHFGVKKLNYSIKKGDLILVTKELPDWDWLEYTTNDVGIVMRVRDYNYGFLILDVYFFRNEIKTAVPDYLTEPLTDCSNASR